MPRGIGTRGGERGGMEGLSADAVGVLSLGNLASGRAIVGDCLLTWNARYDEEDFYVRLRRRE